MGTMMDTATVEERYTKAVEELGHQLEVNDQKDAGALDPADVRGRIEGYAGPEADREWWADFHRKRAGAGAKDLAAVETEIARLVDVVEACCRENAALRPLHGNTIQTDLLRSQLRAVQSRHAQLERVHRKSSFPGQRARARGRAAAPARSGARLPARRAHRPG